MSHIADLARLGILPGRHHEVDYDVSLRSVPQVVEIETRDRNGKYKIRDGSRGDLLGFARWAPDVASSAKGRPGSGGSTTVPRGTQPTAPTSPALARPGPGWHFAWPSVVVDPEGEDEERGRTAVGSRTIARDQIEPEPTEPQGDAETGQRVRPVRDAQVLPDLRFVRKAPVKHDWQTRFPRDWPGIVVAATEEHAQVDVWQPSAAGVVAVAHAGSSLLSTRVFDLDAQSRVDPARWAYAHTFWRVTRPRGGVVGFGDVNIIAWQIGDAGRGRMRSPVYGLVVDVEGDPVELTEVDDGSELVGQQGSATIPRQPPDRVGRVPAPTPPRGPVPLSTIPRDATPPPAPPRVDTAIGAVSVHAGGPFDVGGPGCQHQIASTLDGQAVRVTHLSTKSVFLGEGGDAPIEFQGDPYVPPRPMPHLSRGHIRHDPASVHQWPGGAGQGLWRLLTESSVYEVPPKEPPVGEPTTTPRGGPGGGQTIPRRRRRRPGPGLVGPGRPPRGRPRLPPEEEPEPGKRGRLPPDRPPPEEDHHAPRTFAVVVERDADAMAAPALTDRWAVSIDGEHPPLHAATTPHAFPELVARPALRGRLGGYDITRDRSPTAAAVRAYDDRAPIAARLIAYAAQVGDEPAYGQSPARSRWRGGTAPGGWALMPPGVDLEDLEVYGGAPPGQECSRTYFAAYRECARFAGGTPHLKTGGVASGYEWYVTSGGDLVYRALDADAVATERSRLDVAGKLAAVRLEATVATGTAPLVVASTTVVPNLNASLLQGFGAASFAAASHFHAPSGVLFTAADKILGRVTSGAGSGQEIDCTAAGRALLDDADAAAQRTTLGLGTAALATHAKLARIVHQSEESDLLSGSGADSETVLTTIAIPAVLDGLHLRVTIRARWELTETAGGDGYGTFRVRANDITGDVLYARYQYASDTYPGQIYGEVTLLLRVPVSAADPWPSLARVDELVWRSEDDAPAHDTVHHSVAFDVDKTPDDWVIVLTGQLDSADGNSAIQVLEAEAILEADSE